MGNAERRLPSWSQPQQLGHSGPVEAAVTVPSQTDVTQAGYQISCFNSYLIPHWVNARLQA